MTLRRITGVFVQACLGWALAVPALAQTAPATTPARTAAARPGGATPSDTARKASNQPLPTVPREFALEVNRRFEALANPEGLRMNRVFILTWNDKKFPDADLTRMAQQANALLKDGHSMYPQVGQYLVAASYLTRPDRHIRFTPTEFYRFVDSARVKLEPAQVAKLLDRLDEFLTAGVIRRDNSYRYRVQKADGSLTWGRAKYKDRYVFYEYPAMRVNSAVLSLASGAGPGIAPDSVAITGAKGMLDILNGAFYGTAGNLDLTRLGKKPTEMRYALHDYRMDFDTLGLTADSAVLFFPALTPKPVPGKLVETLERVTAPDKATTPRFTSNGLDYLLTDVQKGVDFQGGFTLQGLTIVGYGTPEKPASVLVRRGEKPVLRMATQRINLSERPLRNSRNAVTIFLPDGDTLQHPSMRFLYEADKTEMQLSKELDDPLYRHAMTSSYHRYNFHFEALKWNIAQDSMVFSALVDQQNKLGAVESQDYFLRERFNQFNGVLPFNPIGLIYGYITEVRKNNIGKKRQEIARKKEAEAKKAEAAEMWDFFGDSGGGDAGSVGVDEFGWATDVPEWDGTVEGTSTTAVEPTATTATGEVEVNRLKMEVDLNDILKRYKQTQYRTGFIDALQQLWASGYIDYWPQRQTLRAKPKLLRWAMAARKEKDYDVIQVVSKTPNYNNADLNFVTKTMRVNGVESFTLSDSQRVTVRPQGQSVILRENRDLEFGGLVYAGVANLYGKGLDKFRFDYENFKIDALQLDSVKFFPRRNPGFDAKRNPRLARALEQLRIEGVVGAIYVNKPNNKSGVKPVRGYPVFDCYTTSYVFWNRADVQNGAYRKGQVNFALDPFSLDSLENFDISGLSFQGEFSAGDIVPAFRDTLRPVSDNTYGVNQVFSEGVDLYKGKGRFTNELQMDAYGLHGRGRVDFLVTRADADTFLFLMDSVLANVKNLEVDEQTFEGTYYPQMRGTGLKYKWLVRRGALELETTSAPLELHNGNALFTGKVRITRKGAMGSGLVVSGQTQLQGDSINLSELKISAKNATFRIASRVDSTKFDFIASNADVQQDVKNRITTFQTAEPGRALLEFPGQQYVSSLAEGTYDANQGLITLEAKYPESRLNYLESTAPGAYRLRFSARTATYKQDERRIVATGVDSVLVADAAIFPNGRTLAIDNKGGMEHLSKARVLVDTLNRWHTITEAEIDIRSKYEYKGTGMYPYRTLGVKEQQVELTSIYVRADTTTYARGTIRTEQEFLISDRIYFRDTVELRARNRFLGFSGEVRIQSAKPFFADSWFGFRDPNVNPDTVFVPINNPRNRRTDKPLTIGLHYSGPRRLFYSNFFQEKRDERRDRNVLLAEGGLTYDRQSREFRVGPQGKIGGEAYKGNLVSYDDELGITTVRGRLNMPFFFPAGSASIQASGSWRDDANTNSALSRMLLNINIPGLPDDVLTDLGNKFALYTTGASDVTFSDPQWVEAVAEFADSSSAGEPNTRDLLQQIAKAVVPTDVKTTRFLNGALVLSDVRFSYNDSVRGLWASAPVGVLSIGGKQINKMMDAKIEYRFSRTLPDGTPLSDTLRIYLQSDDVSWMFFEIRGRQLRMVTSEATANAKFQEAAEKGSTRKNPDESMDLTLLKEDDKTAYLRRFARYLFLR